jgi:hypothetical protein
MATLAMFFRRPLATPAAAGGAPPGYIPRESRYCLRALPNEDILFDWKHIDNSRVVREPDPESRGEWSMIGTACALAVLFMGLSTPRVFNVFAGYQLESLRQEQQRLLDEQHDLDIAEARLSRQENLEILAKRRDLSVPAPGQILRLEPKADSKMALNRH